MRDVSLQPGKGGYHFGIEEALQNYKLTRLVSLGWARLVGKMVLPAIGIALAPELSKTLRILRASCFNASLFSVQKARACSRQRRRSRRTQGLELHGGSKPGDVPMIRGTTP
jgi:hypothetical protein